MCGIACNVHVSKREVNSFFVLSNCLYLLQAIKAGHENGLRGSSVGLVDKKLT